MKPVQFLKSKTVNFNGLYMAGVAIAQAFGLQIPVEGVAAGQTILNIILRTVTRIPLAEK